MSVPPESFLDRPLLRQLAGEESFASGEQCFALGGVRQVRYTKESLSAKVAESRVYRVKLWRRRGELLFRCDCALGQEETFCKHCVAAGLAWLSRPSDDDGACAADGTQPIRADAVQREAQRRQVAAHLATLETTRLASLLLEATDYDEILRRRLLLEAIGISRPGKARKRGGRDQLRPDVAAYRQLLREAINPAGFVDYHAMPDYAQGIEEAIRPLARLLEEGWNDEVIELTEFILWELDAASDRVDTGDGLFNKVYDSLQRCHYDACRAAAPDTTRLASRLLHYELEGGLGVFNNAVKTYADILGPGGLAAWRTLLIQQWKEQVRSGRSFIPSGTPPASLDHRRFQLQMLMERLANSEHDVAAQLTVKCADLVSVHDHVALAEWYQRHGREKEAIACAERASVVFGGAQDKMLLNDFLIAAYSRTGQPGKALPLAWEQFCASKELERYRELKQLVLGYNNDDWPEWREKALLQLRKQAGNGESDQGRLVELLIEEGLPDAAWEAAKEGGCGDDLWLSMALRREAAHPEDVLPVYQRKITVLLRMGGQSGYRESLEWLLRVRKLYDRLHMSGEYEKYLCALREHHRRKRAFLGLLGPAGL